MARKRSKNPAAVALGRLGGLAAAGRGGRVRWAKMTAREKAAAMERVRAAKAKKRAAKKRAASP
jgi:hypothetical protein